MNDYIKDPIYDNSEEEDIFGEKRPDIYDTSDEEDIIGDKKPDVFDESGDATTTVVNPEYVYITVPAEYICVYHKIMILMAEYGEDMLKDCKARCSSRSENIIECYNMFNSAVLSRKLGKTKLAETLIKYIKVKLNQLYKGYSDKDGFIFPLDENGQIKAFVTCGKNPKFEVNIEDGKLFEHKMTTGLNEHFKFGDEEIPDVEEGELTADFNVSFVDDGIYITPHADYTIYWNGKEILDYNNASILFYFDGTAHENLTEVHNPSTGVEHNYQMIVQYNNQTVIKELNMAT